MRAIAITLANGELALKIYTMIVILFPRNDMLLSTFRIKDSVDKHWSVLNI